jgi:hypothetical protein
MNTIRYVVLILACATVLYVGIENQTPPPEEYSELPAKVLLGMVLSIIALFCTIAYKVTRTDRNGNPR